MLREVHSFSVMERLRLGDATEVNVALRLAKFPLELTT